MHLSPILSVLLLPTLALTQRNYTYPVAGPNYYTDVAPPRCINSCVNDVIRQNECDTSERNTSSVRCLCQERLYTEGMRECLLECSAEDGQRYFDEGVRSECWFFGWLFVIWGNWMWCAV